MKDLNDLYFFAQIVEHRGFAPAARALGLPKSRLSRRVAELEKRLGARLIQRSSRRFAVTEIGQEVYAHARAMTVEADAAQEAVERARAEPQGLIRLSAPPALVCFQLAEMIAAFMATHSKVSVELISTSRPVDVIGEGIDVALRVRFPPFEESDLIVRRLGESPQRLVAAPSLLGARKPPLRPAELSDLPSLGLATGGRAHQWTLTGPDGASARIPHAPRLVTDDMAQLLSAAVAGVGVAQLPDMVAKNALNSGALVDLMEGWSAPSGEVQAVFASRRGLLPSVRALLDFLAQRFARA